MISSQNYTISSSNMRQIHTPFLQKNSYLKQYIVSQQLATLSILPSPAPFDDHIKKPRGCARIRTTSRAKYHKVMF